MASVATNSQWGERENMENPAAGPPATLSPTALSALAWRVKLNGGASPYGANRAARRDSIYRHFDWDGRRHSKHFRIDSASMIEYHTTQPAHPKTQARLIKAGRRFARSAGLTPEA